MDEANNLRTILVIDDEELLRQLFCSLLEKLGYQVLTAENGRIGLDLIEKKHPDLVLTDLRMPEMDGMELIKQSTRLLPEIPIIVISGTGNVSDAIKAIRLGAYDYLTKPLDFDEVRLTMERAMDHSQLKEENRLLRETLGTHFDQRNIIGRSRAMMKLLETVAQVAPTEATVLITGESGAGKELIRAG